MTTIRQRTPTDIMEDGDFDELIEAIKDIDDSIDDNQWVQGDFVLSVFDHFKGKMKSKELLNEIAIATQIPTETLKVRRRMSKFYRPGVREEIALNFAVKYSVMHVAMGAGDIEDAMEFLDHCRNKGDITSVRHYQRELALYKGKPERPKKLGRITGRYFLDSYGEPSLLLDELPDDVTLTTGKNYAIDIWETTNDE